MTQSINVDMKKSMSSKTIHGHQTYTMDPCQYDSNLNIATVGDAFVFSSPSQISFLMLEIERWFSYFPSVVSKSLKLYHANRDDYCTLEASPTFRKNVSSFCSTLGSRRLDAINHVFHTS
jgi:hypothetical protein